MFDTVSPSTVTYQETLPTVRELGIQDRASSLSAGVVA